MQAGSKNVLMIAVEYPPCNSAGVQRTLKFSEHLPDFGWRPLVLTAAKHVYEKLDENQTVPKGVKVSRAFGLDSLKHLRIGGKYLRPTAFPDRYLMWYLPAVIKGLYLIIRYRPKVIYSSFPYYTAHWVALTLAWLTKVPWVADYRDPSHHLYLFADGDDHALEKEFSNPVSRWIERRTVRRASQLLFSTENMRQHYREYYSGLVENSAVIENGYNDSLLASLQPGQRQDTQFILLHSGALCMGRDPETLIEALAVVRQQVPDNKDIQRIKICFRGAEPSTECQRLIDQHDLGGCVEFLPPVTYKESLAEMMAVDALLLMQGSVFLFQIPGKAYEYIATQKPILALTEPDSATGGLASSVEGCCVAGMNDVDAIVDALKTLVTLPRQNRAIEQYGRKRRSEQLANLLDSVSSARV